MGPWIAVAGVLLTLLGIIVLWRHRRGEDDHSDHEHGGEQVAWLLLAPVLALLLIAPGALGSYSLGRTGSAIKVRSGHGVFAPLDPEAGAHEMSLLEFNQRAFEGTEGASFNGATVRVIGFVGPTKPDGFVVARYSIACCAADALAATALVTGWTGPAFRRATRGSRSKDASSRVERSSRGSSRRRSPWSRRRTTRTSDQVPVIRLTGGVGTAPCPATSRSRRRGRRCPGHRRGRRSPG